MTKINALNFSRLQVKELGSLGSTTLEKVRPLAANQSIPSQMVDDLNISVVTFDSAVGYSFNPQETKMLNALDRQTDKSFQVFKGMAKVAANRKDEKVSQAGEQLLAAIRRRGNYLYSLPIPLEIDVLEQLINDIKQSPELTESVSLITADDDFKQLEDDNMATKVYWLQIKSQQALTSTVSSIEATRKLRSSLKTVFNYLNSMADYNADIETLIVDLNAVIDHFATNLKTRATIRTKAKESENSEEEELA